MTRPLRWVLGVDSGGSGLRIALGAVRDGDGGGERPGGLRGGPPAPGGGVRTVAVHETGEPLPTGPGGIDAGRLLERLVPTARRLLAEAGAAETGAAGDARPVPGPASATEAADGGPVAVAVGAAGMAGLGDRLRAELPGALREALGVRRLALASDAVTAYAGALGRAPGTVVAAGTGLVALGTDLERWRRADGWGHLLGDCGSGAWIGRAGLEAALRAHDGRRGGSTALLARAEAVFGPVGGLPGRLYPRPDRAAVLASFAPHVARCAAETGDAVATGVMALAARHVAEAAAAVHPRGGGGAVALTGGLFRVGDPLLVPLRAELARHLPGARPVTAAGDPLSGALALAGWLADGPLPLPREPGLLDTYSE
ncbi:BadF/BadG/BcrA/BcrD ATPase family protein [Streptomyces sp. DH12]|uniref:N-acetylglucosamine kinase n=1 Tax=Streptomyces sp. DH12 TaxID=2857010 RepID=UPI001E396A49|nr:BadF/BadG/BcrA/BcrD ATPase family protein [Streptomyces sp. DH12]